MKKILIATALLVTAGPCFAEEKAVKRRENKDRVEITGTIVSIGATLEALGANAEETLHSKDVQGLKDADGKLWTFVDNTKGHGVITNEDLRDLEIKILGWKIPGTQYIEISKYEVKEGDTWVAYDYCKTCGWEAGDNKDTDLCEDCKGEEEEK